MSGFAYSKHVRPSVAHDVSVLVPKLRDIDKTELTASGWGNAVVAVMYSYDLSAECYTITSPADVSPIGIFGVGRSRLSPLGYRSIWLLGTDSLTEKYSLQFLKLSRTYVNTFLEKYRDPLGNSVMASNSAHIRWLEWCGFEKIDAFNHPSSGVLFHTYVKLK